MLNTFQQKRHAMLSEEIDLYEPSQELASQDTSGRYDPVRKTIAEE